MTPIRIIGQPILGLFEGLPPPNLRAPMILSEGVDTCRFLRELLPPSTVAGLCQRPHPRFPKPIAGMDGVTRGPRRVIRLGTSSEISIGNLRWSMGSCSAAAVRVANARWHFLRASRSSHARSLRDVVRPTRPTRPQPSPQKQPRHLPAFILSGPSLRVS